VRRRAPLRATRPMRTRWPWASCGRTCASSGPRCGYPAGAPTCRSHARTHRELMHFRAPPDRPRSPGRGKSPSRAICPTRAWAIHPRCRGRSPSVTGSAVRLLGLPVNFGRGKNPTKWGAADPGKA